MKPERLREAARVMEAAAEGKQIQLRLGAQWVDIHEPEFQWAMCEYRVKPEPVKMRVQLLRSKDNGHVYAFRLSEVPGYTQHGQWEICSDVVEIEVRDEQR